jgi:type II secretory ATPase GspE/PulE/Tfp pilus assembly ATPase PilB-like protein
MADLSKNDRLGQRLVAEGFLTRAQLQEVERARESDADQTPLDEMLVRKEYVTRRQLELVKNHHGRRLRLGEVLIQGRVISQEQLDVALKEQARLKEPLGQVLVRMNFVTDEAMRQALATQLNIPFLDLNKVSIDRTLARVINANYARRHFVVPISEVGQVLTIAMDDPTNQPLVEELVRTTGRVVTVVTASREAIKRAFDRVYGHETEQKTPTGTAVDTVALAEEEPGLDYGKSKSVDEYKNDHEASDIVRRIMRVAIERGCSDVHLETLAEKFMVRFRTDGVLQETNFGQEHNLGPGHARRIISRIKVLANLDISEHRRPQDGSFRIRVTRKGLESAVDFRVSVLPSYTGESVVMRVLDRTGAPRSVERLGFSSEVTARLVQILKQPAGIFFVTGPTGSGKTTTLYASLMTLYRPEIRILTAENPIEYVYEQFSQSEVNERIGNTFASYLRGFLRHDPDVIMVGEIRDEDTAAMSLRAAQTGHLVLSTLHTNTAAGSVPRLTDLGADGNLLASSLLGVLSQRLVREVCTSCRVPHTPPQELLREFFDVPPSHAKWMMGRGCAACHFTGYKGRLAIAELWMPSERDVLLISKGARFEEIRESSRAGTISMARDIMDRLLEGRTTLEELIRVLPYEHVSEFRRYFDQTLERAAS